MVPFCAIENLPTLLPYILHWVALHSSRNREYVVLRAGLAYRVLLISLETRNRGQGAHPYLRHGSARYWPTESKCLVWLTYPDYSGPRCPSRCLGRCPLALGLLLIQGRGGESAHTRADATSRRIESAEEGTEGTMDAGDTIFRERRKNRT